MNEPVFDHERLDVYRLSIEYAAFSYRIAKTLSGMNRPAPDQWLRAAQSIQRTQAASEGSIEYEYEYRDAEYEYEDMPEQRNPPEPPVGAGLVENLTRRPRCFQPLSSIGRTAAIRWTRAIHAPASHIQFFTVIAIQAKITVRNIVDVVSVSFGPAAAMTSAHRQTADQQKSTNHGLHQHPLPGQPCL